MKKKKYLPLYYKWLKKGKIPYTESLNTQGGLCSIFHDDALFKLINPVGGCWSYWGYREDEHRYYTIYNDAVGFTPLRQTVLLLMAAMNNEL